MFPENVKGMRTAIGPECKVFFEEIQERPSVVFHIKCPNTGKIFTFQYTGKTSHVIDTLSIQFNHLIGKIRTDDVGYARLENHLGARMEIIKEKGKILKARIFNDEGTSPDITFINGSLDIIARRVKALEMMMAGYLLSGDTSKLDIEFTIYHELQLYYHRDCPEYRLSMYQGGEEFVRTIEDQNCELTSRVNIKTSDDLTELVKHHSGVVSAMFHNWALTFKPVRWQVDNVTVNGYHDEAGKLHLSLIDPSVSDPSNAIMMVADSEMATDYVRGLQAEAGVFLQRLRNDGILIDPICKEAYTQFSRITDLFVLRLKLGNEVTNESYKRMSCCCDEPVWELMSVVEGLRVYQGHFIRGRVKSETE